jgi:hypothetical protein
MNANQDDLILTPAGPRPRDKVHMAALGQAVRQNEDGTISLITEEELHLGKEMRMAEDYVITPGGFRPKGRVHLIEPGHLVSGEGGRLRKVHFLGEVVADFGPLIPRPGNEPLMPRNVVRTRPGPLLPAQIPALGSGWITYAWWQNATGRPITSFVTTWVVPPAPRTQSGQLIYLFNGIQNSTMIYQPVLQWGYNNAFGGNYWCVASCMPTAREGTPFTPPLSRLTLARSWWGS